MNSSSSSRILIVDDNELNRDILVRRLTRQGYKTTTAVGGDAALILIGEQPFDLVLLDIEMPDGDGISTLQTIRSRYSQAELPVIMVTARTESTEVVRTL